MSIISWLYHRREKGGESGSRWEKERERRASKTEIGENASYRVYVHARAEKGSFGEVEARFEAKLYIPCVSPGVCAPEARQDEPARAPGHCWPLHTCWTVRKEPGA